MKGPTILLLLLASQTLASSPINVEESAPTFYPIEKTLSVQCDGKDIKVTDSSVPCSASADKASGVAVAIDSLGFTLSDGVWSLQEPALRQYNFWCGTFSFCTATIMYKMRVARNGNTLECSFNYTLDGEDDAARPEKVTWLKNNVTLTHSDISDDDIVSDAATPGLAFYSTSYTLVDSSKSDETSDGHGSSEDTSKSKPSGSYECVLTYLSQNLSESLDIVEPPVAKLMFKPDQEQYTEGDAVTVICNVTGFPQSSVTWSYKGAELTPDNVTEDHNNDFSEFSFTINDLALDENRGEYSCMAVNNNGSSSASRVLYARGKLAPLWPFLGIVAQVIVLVICIVIGEQVRKKKLADKMARQRAAQ